MRITRIEHKAIKDAIALFDPTAKVFLYGSRVDDQKRGGDIDLLILSDVISANERRMLKLKIYDQIGEQKIDIIIAKDLDKPFVRIAYETGIQL